MISGPADHYSPQLRTALVLTGTGTAGAYHAGVLRALHESWIQRPNEILDRADKMYQAGVPAQEAQHRYVVPEKFKNFPVFAWGFTIGPAITKLYAEWQSK